MKNVFTPVRCIKGALAVILFIFITGCVKNKTVIENERYIMSATEEFIDALIVQDEAEIISYIIESADKYYDYVNISSMVKSALGEQPKEMSFLLAYILEYEIMNVNIDRNYTTAVVTVNFKNMSNQKINLEKIDDKWLINYRKFNNEFNSNLIKNSLKVLFKFFLISG